ncbi:beta-glucosidase [Microbacterium sp. LMI12-1-1.1]|uniref:beta-glucosidase family protein n=1 Tax=Microbacterium sp. LMI12-1-1.1 TaxID=3135225 RepID=UPI00344A4247
MPETTATVLTDELAATLVGRLTLEQKVRLLTGASFWTLSSEPAIGLEEIVMSDGPAGVRGQTWDERDPSLSLPSPTAMAASWDAESVRRLGALVGSEARRKGVHVVLGPNVNIQRSPRAGRHFEEFSEDPYLSGEIGAAYVAGVQSQGVAATPKHFVANDSETDRMTADVIVGERTLREVYLAPFETIVTRARPWMIMSAYNSVNGTTMTEHPLLISPLKELWGFDGAVVSDWMAVRDTAGAGVAAQDLAMPGPEGVWGEKLVRAVRAGDVNESAVDAKVVRLLRLAGRVGALHGVRSAAESPHALDHESIPDLLSAAAADGMVLATNNEILPLDRSRINRIALLGQHALHGRGQGGGSATVFPPHEISPHQGVTDAFPDATVSYAPGGRPAEPLLPLDRGVAVDPITESPGVHVRFLGQDGEVLLDEHRDSGRLFWVGDPILTHTAVVEVRATFTPPTAGEYALGFAGLGDFTLTIEDDVISHGMFFPEGTDPFMAFLNPPTQSFPVTLATGQRIDLRLEHRPEKVNGVASVTFTIGYEEPLGSPDDELSRAATLAAEADIAIVVVGTTEHIESEGFDRTTLHLPADQDELVRTAIAANPNTIVVVNAGAPVIMPWLHDAAAVLLTWFPGQEFGRALADILSGAREPGGRLTHTWPAREEDVPVWQVEPSAGRLYYAEGVHVGYREWVRREERGGPSAALAFGHGRGYTTWNIESLELRSVIGTNTVSAEITVTNTGSRRGKHVVQLYASRSVPSAVDRPVRWLVGYVTLRADPGETITAGLDIPARLLQYWNADTRDWVLEPGEYRITAAHSSMDLAVSDTVVLLP